MIKTVAWMQTLQCKLSVTLHFVAYVMFRSGEISNKIKHKCNAWRVHWESKLRKTTMEDLEKRAKKNADHWVAVHWMRLFLNPFEYGSPSCYCFWWWCCTPPRSCFCCCILNCIRVPPFLSWIASGCQQQVMNTSVGEKLQWTSR